MMNQWFILKHEGKGIDRYLNKKGCSTVAVYGMAVYGRHVIRELQGSNIKVLYGIDRRKLSPYMDIAVLPPTEKLPPVDIIINTVLGDHANIQSDLAKLTDSPVVSLEDVVFESY